MLLYAKKKKLLGFRAFRGIFLASAAQIFANSKS